MTSLRHLLGLFALVCGLVGAPVLAPDLPAQGAATATTPLPAGLTQAQFDALVQAIGDAVARRLAPAGGAGTTTTGPAAAAPSATPSATDVMLPSFDEAIGRAIDTLTAQLREVLGALPGWPAEFRAVLARMSRGDSGTEWPFVVFAALLAGSVLAALFAEQAVRRALARPRRHLADGAEAPGFLRLAGLFLFDALGALALVGVAHVARVTLFHDGAFQARAAAVVYTVLVAWRLAMLAVELVLRPDAPAGRLVPLDDALARQLRRLLSLIVLVAFATLAFNRAMRAGGMPEAHVRLQMMLAGLICAGALLYAIGRLRGPLDAWIAARAAPRFLARLLTARWAMLAYALVAALLVTWELGVLTHSHHAFVALARTLVFVALFVALDAIAGYVGRLVFRAPDAAAEQARSAATLFHRCIRVGLWIVAGVLIAEIWLVDTTGAVHQSIWTGVGRSLMSAGATLFIAFVAWELVKFFIDRHLIQSQSPLAALEQEEQSEDAQSPRERRLRTMLPLLRIALAGIIVVLTVLIALSELGVNTAPLIAGASVFGLAISFGSQSLVRDIVSGIFFMADDAFRVGEYIDTGRAKGTVEGMSLRSIRLRHQNGPVATIPFGQILSVTNFSRDWATVKFNLRLARDTDIEKVRKMVKKLGQEMLLDPEIGGDFLLPLKLQGMSDIEDNALICRLKFTAKPTRPTYLQRHALKRIFNLFQEQGVKFASNQVTVQTTDGAPFAAGVTTTLAGAAANMPPAVRPTPTGG